jgi:hypothetical protein
MIQIRPAYVHRHNKSMLFCNRMGSGIISHIITSTALLIQINQITSTTIFKIEAGLYLENN